MLSMIEAIIRDLLIFVAVMFALFIVVLVVVSKMPDDNPLKRILTALSYRVGMTLAAGVVAVPIEPIPGLDVLFDIGVPILLVWSWFTFSDCRERTRRRGSQPKCVVSLTAGLSRRYRPSRERQHAEPSKISL